MYEDNSRSRTDRKFWQRFLSDAYKRSLDFHSKFSDACLNFNPKIYLINSRRYLEVVVVASAVTFESEHGEEERQFVAGRSVDSNLAVGAVRVVSGPSRTHYAPAQRRQHPVAR